MKKIITNKKMNKILKKCKSLSKLSKLGRSRSYTSLRDDVSECLSGSSEEAVVFVGSSRRRYMISAKHLTHPVMSALIDRSDVSGAGTDTERISVKCEVVLFDHLLWMLENADVADDVAVAELAQLYAC